MKKFISMIAAMLLVIFLTSCATPPPPVAFHNTDNTALVLKSLDGQTSQMLAPNTSTPAKNDRILSIARSLPQHQTAVVMLENYTEPSLGEQFRDRGTPLFICLRQLGYEHIIFVQGQNVPDPNGLITLAEYY
jgi:hypothetical protein